MQIVEALPRGLTGKVLRHRLADDYVQQRSERARLATGAVAASQLEQDVLAIWRCLLKTDAVGPEDNFSTAAVIRCWPPRCSPNWNRCSVG